MEDLSKFVKKKQFQGFTDKQIKKQLKDNGYSNYDIYQAFTPQFFSNLQKPETQEEKPAYSKLHESNITPSNIPPINILPTKILPTNIEPLAIAAIIFAWIIPFFGAILGVIALFKLRDSEKGGKPLAVMAIIIGIVSSISFFLSFLSYF